MASDNITIQPHGALTIGPLSIRKTTFAGAVFDIENALEKKQRLRLAFCNAHTALLALRDESFCHVLSKMTVLNDGVGIDIASRFLDGHSFPENLNGTDFVPRLFDAIDRPVNIYLLGARRKVVTEASEIMARRYPRHEIVGVRDGYFTDGDTAGIIREINEKRTDILLVAMGNPVQERFIVENSERLDCPVAIGVGALFDFMSGSVPRAPAWIRLLRLEWLFRLANEPRRLFYRYVIGIPKFLLAVGKIRLVRDLRGA